GMRSAECGARNGGGAGAGSELMRYSLLYWRVALEPGESEGQFGVFGGDAALNFRIEGGAEGGAKGGTRGNAGGDQVGAGDLEADVAPVGVVSVEKRAELRIRDGSVEVGEGL